MKNILIIEDNNALCTLLVRISEKYYIVYSVSSLSKARNFLEGKK